MRNLITKEEALVEMAALCARSEQCAADIYKKLRGRSLSHSDAMDVIADLEDRGFIDHTRYARSFTNDKMRFSAWGRIKIRVALLAKSIPENCIREALGSLDPAEYAEAVSRAACAKASGLDLTSYEGRLKLYRHLLSRGFESDISLAEVKRQASK